MLVVVVVPFVIKVVSRGIMIFRVLSADHCSINSNLKVQTRFAVKCLHSKEYYLQFLKQNSCAGNANNHTEEGKLSLKQHTSGNIHISARQF